MPIYEYKNLLTGAHVELFSTVARRDYVPRHLRRVLSVSSCGPFTGCAMDPTCADAAVPRAFKQLEATQSRESIEHKSGFSVRDIKRTWNFK